jgi:phage/plasmid-associated DNA primase
MVRGLYQEPIEVKSQIKSWMTTNELPEVKSDDGGTWRRVRVIDFNSKFVENPDPLNPNEFLLDDTLKGKISMWAPAFASYLIHIYTTLYDVPNKIPEPDEVQISTNKYRKDQDLVREYYDNMVEITENKMDTLKKKDLFTHFKLWFKELHEGEPLPKSKKVYDFIEKEIKQKYGINGWPYIRFRRETTLNSDGVYEEENAPNDLDV